MQLELVEKKSGGISKGGMAVRGRLYRVNVPSKPT